MMTSRRIISSERTLLNKDPHASHSTSAPSNITPAVPAAVIYKLLGFTFAMIAGPLATYYLTVQTIFNGSSTWAGASAAAVANLVLVGYVVVALREDQSEQREAEEKRRKAL